MILMQNLPRVAEIAARSERVLDVGGWFQPFNLATHMIDIGSYETRRRAEALDPENAERFTADTWTVHDVCSPPWPFPDKFFDFSFCSHLLEDVRDPIAVCRELVRVSRAGYLETPSRAREIFTKARLFGLKASLGKMPEVGFHHHRWFCEVDGNHVRFIAKDQRILLDRRRFITRGELGRRMTEAESGCCLFWTDGFTFGEAFDVSDADLGRYKTETLRRLKSA